MDAINRLTALGNKYKWTTLLLIWGSHSWSSRSKVTGHLNFNFFFFSKINLMYFCSIIFVHFRFVFWKNFTVLINIYAIIMIHFTIENSKKKKHKKKINTHFSMNSLFLIKIETRPLKSSFWKQNSISWWEHRKKIETLVNSLVVFINNCSLLLGCGFKCILMHSYRLLFVKVFLLLLFYMLIWSVGFCIIITTFKPETCIVLHKTLHICKQMLQKWSGMLYQSLILLGLIWF